VFPPLSISFAIRSVIFFSESFVRLRAAVWPVYIPFSDASSKRSLSPPGSCRVRRRDNVLNFSLPGPASALKFRLLLALAFLYWTLQGHDLSAVPGPLPLLSQPRAYPSGSSRTGPISSNSPGPDLLVRLLCFSKALSCEILYHWVPRSDSLLFRRLVDRPRCPFLVLSFRLTRPLTRAFPFCCFSPIDSGPSYSFSRTFPLCLTTSSLT